MRHSLSFRNSSVAAVDVSESTTEIIAIGTDTKTSPCADTATDMSISAITDMAIPTAATIIHIIGMILFMRIV